MLGDDYAPLLLGVAWTFTCLSALFVAARFCCRLRCHIELGWDDFWAGISLVPDSYLAWLAQAQHC